MVSLETIDEINEYIREYMHYYNMNGTLEMFEKEIKTRQMAKRLRNDKESFKKDEPRLHLLFNNVS